jgi:hypothetical protein
MMDISVTRGHEGSYDITITKADGTAFDLTGRTLAWTASRSRTGTPELGPVALTITDAPAGRARLRLPAALTATLPAGDLAVYAYQITVDDATSDPIVALRGVLYVLPTV